MATTTKSKTVQGITLAVKIAEDSRFGTHTATLKVNRPWGDLKVERQARAKAYRIAAEAELELAERGLGGWSLTVEGYDAVLKIETGDGSRTQAKIGLEILEAAIKRVS